MEGKVSESEIDLSLEYDHQLNKEMMNCSDDRMMDELTVSRREPEGKDDDSINTMNSGSVDTNKMMPLGEYPVFFFSYQFGESGGEFELYVRIYH